MTTAADLVTWDGHTAAALAQACDVPRVDLFSEVASTLDVAHLIAAADGPAGRLVLADAQRAGRGRMGRSWASAPGHGVWCTLVERPHPGALDVLSLRVGMAIARRLDAIARERVGVKWPNDLALAAGKVGGILVEARWSGATLAWVAIGVGINVVPPADVSTAAGLPRGTSRLDVLRTVVAGVREAAQTSGPLTTAELNSFAGRDILTGRRLTSPASGVARGITSDGALVVETASGIERHRAGTVLLAEGEST